MLRLDDYIADMVKATPDYKKRLKKSKPLFPRTFYGLRLRNKSTGKFVYLQAKCFKDYFGEYDEIFYTVDNLKQATSFDSIENALEYIEYMEYSHDLDDYQFDMIVRFHERRYRFYEPVTLKDKWKDFRSWFRYRMDDYKYVRQRQGSNIWCAFWENHPIAIILKLLFTFPELREYNRLKFGYKEEEGEDS